MARAGIDWVGVFSQKRVCRVCACILLYTLYTPCRILPNRNHLGRSSISTIDMLSPVTAMWK